MTPAELRQARMTLGLSQAELGAELDLTEATIAAWEAGTASIPRSYVQRIAWDAAVKAQAVALEASGLPSCVWVQAFTATMPADAKTRLRQAEEFERHVATCPQCIARAEYVRSHLPPLPPPPLSFAGGVLVSVMNTIQRLPAWARPAAYGALIVSTMVFIRILLMSFAQGPSLRLFGMVGLGLLVGAYLGGVGGITYSLVRPSLRKLGRIGDYLTGIACMAAYLLACGLPAAIWLNEPMFRETSGWISLGIVAVIFGLVIGRTWFREA